LQTKRKSENKRKAKTKKTYEEPDIFSKFFGTDKQRPYNNFEYNLQKLKERIRSFGEA